MALRIAVTGATGFVGRALVPLLTEAGHDLSLLMRNPVRDSLVDSVRYVKGDLQNAQALRTLTQGADVVLHVAGAIAAATTADFMRTNVDGTIAVANAAKGNAVKRFIHVSSLAARETVLNGYSASKAAAEKALGAYVSDFEICIMRPAAIYGPGDTATFPLLQALMSRRAFIPGAATSRFAMVHVNDVARALVAAVKGPQGTFSIHDGMQAHTWPELIALTQELFGRPQQVTYIPQTLALLAGFLGDGVAKVRGKPSLVNSGQIRQIYHDDWSVNGEIWPLANPVTLQQGLLQTIRWYQQQGLLPDVTAADRSRAN